MCLPSGEICGAARSGLPKSTSRGMSGGSSALAFEAVTAVASTAAVNEPKRIMRLPPGREWDSDTDTRRGDSPAEVNYSPHAGLTRRRGLSAPAQAGVLLRAALWHRPPQPVGA